MTASIIRLCVATLALLASATSWAQAPLRIAVLPTDIYDPAHVELGDSLRETMRRTLEEAPEYVAVGGVQMTPEEARLAFSCFDEAAGCMSKINQAVGGAQRVTWARVERRDSAWQLRVRMLDLDAERYVIDESFTLPGGDERLEELTLLTASVVRGKRPQMPLTSRLIIDSQPPGADVMIDGRQMGAAPVTAEVIRGRHLIEVGGLEGRRSVKREVDVGPGEQRELIQLPIVPKQVVAEPVAEPTRWSTWVGVGALVVAAAAAGVGAYASLEAGSLGDEADAVNAQRQQDAAAWGRLAGTSTEWDDYADRKARSDARHAELESDRDSMRTLAVASWVTAGVAAAAGVYFLAFHEGDEPVLTPTVGPTGAGASLTVRF